MNIIYSGGYDKDSEESIKQSFIYTYKPAIDKAVEKGKKIAFVTLAKPDHYYDNLLNPLYKDIVDIIDSRRMLSVNWPVYDGIFLLGGLMIPLLGGLKQTGFDLKKLKQTAVVLGDSAGAYVLSSYFYNTPPGPRRGEEIEFLPGLNPEAKNITMAHTNNRTYFNELLESKVYKFALSHGLTVVSLRENEQRMVVDGRVVGVEKEKLFL